MAKSGARDLVKEAAWRRRLARHADSGQTVRAWCHRHRVKEGAFFWWRRELARRDTEEPLSTRRGTARTPSSRRNAEARAGSFVPVHLTDDPARDGDSWIEIELTDGRRVRVTGTVNREMLAQVLDVLTSCPLSQQASSLRPERSESSLRPERSGSQTVAPERRVC